MELGRGVICDTPQQAERFATLRSGGKDTEVALRAVNDEIKVGRACGLASVLFTGGEPVARLSMMGRSVSILEITVHAFGNGAAWTQVPATVQYTVVTEKGRIA